jgi:hypothetical protein
MAKKQEKPKRGRPPGSKNKSTTSSTKSSTKKGSKPVAKKSKKSKPEAAPVKKNKKKAKPEAAPAKKRGRPAGSTNKAKASEKPAKKAAVKTVVDAKHSKLMPEGWELIHTQRASKIGELGYGYNTTSDNYGLFFFKMKEGKLKVAGSMEVESKYDTPVSESLESFAAGDYTGTTTTTMIPMTTMTTKMTKMSPTMTKMRMRTTRTTTKMRMTTTMTRMTTEPSVTRDYSPAYINC